MFSGSMVAIITPFQNGKIDYRTLEELIEFHLESGTDGIVPVGTTGESPTLTHAENKKVIEFVVKAVGGKIPVIAGTGSNSTAEAIDMTEYARKVGADASLQVTPYYNKPTQEGFYQHFKMIAQEVNLPVVLYNIPGRSAAGMTAETIIRLSEIENIVAVKEATGSMDIASDVAGNCDLTILSGDDSMTLPLASVGAKGVISVVANIVPADVKAMTDLILQGDLVSARKWHHKLFTLSKSLLSMSTNPIPIKAAMEILDMAPEEMRLPMTQLEESKKTALKKILQEYGLL
jgi:4-hydroxy-tetrahydrodipicolinate synthase